MLKVLTRLALTPGGGSKVKIREPLSRFTGTCERENGNKHKFTYSINQICTIHSVFKHSYITAAMKLHLFSETEWNIQTHHLREYTCTCTVIEIMSLSIIDLGVDFHGEEEAEVGVGSECVKLLFQLHQPLRSQVYVLQQDPATCTHQETR